MCVKLFTTWLPIPLLHIVAFKCGTIDMFPKSMTRYPVITIDLWINNVNTYVHNIKWINLVNNCYSGSNVVLQSYIYGIFSLILWSELTFYFNIVLLQMVKYCVNIDVFI